MLRNHKDKRYLWGDLKDADNSSGGLEAVITIMLSMQDVEATLSMH
jgi:hypothetical protein